MLSRRSRLSEFDAEDARLVLRAAIDSSWRQRALLKDVDLDDVERLAAESVCRALRDPRTRGIWPTLVEGRLPRRRLLSVTKGVAASLNPLKTGAILELCSDEWFGLFLEKTLERIDFSICDFFPW